MSDKKFTIAIAPTEMFNAAQIFSTAVLFMIMKSEKYEMSLRRHLNPEDLAVANAWLGVGGEYKPSLRRFDPDASAAKELRRPDASAMRIPYGLAGLVWKINGIDALQHCVPRPDRRITEDFHEGILCYAHDSIDDLLVQKIDLGDDVRRHIDIAAYGQDIDATMYLESDNIIYTLERLIYDCNYHRPGTDSVPNYFNDKERQFANESVEAQRNFHLVSTAEFYAKFPLTGLFRRVYAKEHAYAHKNNIKKALNDRKHPNILELPEFVPTEVGWEAFLLDEMKDTQTLFVVMRGGNEFYRIVAVPEKIDGGEQPRLLLPEAWAGETGAKLEALTKIPGAKIVSKQRLLAGAKGKEAAFELAVAAIEYHSARNAGTALSLMSESTVSLPIVASPGLPATTTADNTEIDNMPPVPAS